MGDTLYTFLPPCQIENDAGAIYTIFFLKDTCRLQRTKQPQSVLPDSHYITCVIGLEGAEKIDLQPCMTDG